jgi:hypothetical protein
VEKSCSTCKYGKTSYPNKRCTDCIDQDHPGCSIDWHRLWEPSEQAVKAYIEKINEGSNGMIESDYDVVKEYNSVSKPKHYMLFEATEIHPNKNIEVRDVIGKLTEKLAENVKGEFYSYQFAADYVQLMQYLMRFMDKNGKEDLEKARWYLDKMIESY